MQHLSTLELVREYSLSKKPTVILEMLVIKGNSSLP